MDETYERILLGIDEEKQEYAIRLFRCLAFSRRPLRVKELAEVIAVEFNAGRIPRLNVDLRPGDADEAVLSACSTLVAIIKPNDNTLDNNIDRVVQFSHYSVKEFLTSERLARSMRGDLSQYHISPEPAHTVLAQSCISTLLQLDSDIEGVHRDFPLAEYGSQNWFHHAQCHGVAPQIQKGIERLFDPDRRHFSTWISTYDIDHTPSLERSTRTKVSPLYYAALCGIGSLVEHLVVTRRQDPNQSRGSQGTPLHVAVVSGHTSIARLLLEHAADANARDRHGITPLHKVVERGNFDIAQLLINHGADVNAFIYRTGYQLHMVTPQSERHNLMGPIPSGIADGNARGKNKSTLLHDAAKCGNLKTAQWLIGHGADVNILDDQRDCPLHNALRSQEFDVVELLVKGGADVNVRNIHHSSPLYEAVEIGSLDAVLSLLSRGAFVNTLGNKGDSPLHKAVQLQKLDIVELLLKRGADVNIRNMYSSTPLNEAVHSGSLNIMQLLINHGADVNSPDYQRDSPLRTALRSQNSDVVELLLKGGANVNSRNIYNSTLLHEAVESRNVNIVELLIGHGADVNALDSFGDSSLHKALRSQNTDFEEFLVNNATNANTLHNQYPMPPPPLHASQQGIYAMAQLLLGHCANVNARGRGRKTPLHLASLGGSLDVARLLIEHGADVDAQDDKCQTPFSIALALGHRKLARFLSNGRVPEHDA